jgi:hypothetical protein
MSIMYSTDPTSAIPSRLRRQTQQACRSCGRPLTGQRSDARYCSAACRLRGHRGVSNGADGPEPIPPDLNRCTAKVKRLDPHKIEGRNRQKTGGSVAHIAGPSRVIAAELGDPGRPVVSPDGVVCEVRQLRPRALVDNGGR